MTDSAIRFRDAMCRAGVSISDLPIADDEIHRFHIEGDKSGTENGWYVLHSDGIPAGAYGCWKRHIDEKWCAKASTEMSSAERRQRNKQMEEANAKREAEQERRYAEARERAKQIWEAAEPATDDHLYLQTKRVEAYGLRTSRGNLVIPVRNAQVELQSLQFITPGGEKKFLSGGKVRGCYFGIGNPVNRLLIAEGFATGATLHAATGDAVAVAFNAGNLKPVAEAMKAKFPDAHITLCADNDAKTEGNPGLSKATEAASAIGADVAIPEGQGDFNDLAVNSGLEAVRTAIDSCLPAPSPDQCDRYTVDAPGGRFKVSETGIYFEETADKDSVFIASRIDVLAQSRDNANEAWGRLVVFDDPEGVRHKWCLPMSMLAGDGVDMRRELLNQGVKISGTKKARDLLSSYIQQASPNQYARAVLKTGWDNAGNYVLPNQVISSHGDPDLVYLQSVNSAAGRWYTCSGELSDWQQQVAAKCPGNSRLILAVCAAFAAPLLERVNAESGGLHIYGGSSQGKTTALLVATSVWGAPGERIQSWRATANGLEGVAAGHNDSLLALDEISQADPRQVGEAAYMLANQTGKSRARRDGALRVPVRWRLLFLSSGEQSIESYLRQAGQHLSAGQLVRFVDIPATPANANFGLFETVHGAAGSNDVLKGQAFADSLIGVSKRHYGTAGIVFLERLVSEGPGEVLRRRMDQFKADQAPADASSQVLRVLDRFAILAAAGELTTAWGITGWNQGVASEGIARCFQDWLAARGGATLHEDAELIENVTDFLQRFGESRFQDWHTDERTHKPVDRAGYRKLASDGGTDFYVFPNVFRNEICKGHEPRLASKILAEAGMLEREDKSYMCSRKLPGSQKSSRWYVLRQAEITQLTQQDETELGSLKASNDGRYPTYPTYPTKKPAEGNGGDSESENTAHDFTVGQVGYVGYSNNGGASEVPNSYPTSGESRVKLTQVVDGRKRGVV